MDAKFTADFCPSLRLPQLSVEKGSEGVPIPPLLPKPKIVSTQFADNGSRCNEHGSEGSFLDRRVFQNGHTFFDAERTLNFHVLNCLIGGDAPFIKMILDYFCERFLVRFQ